MSKYNVKMVKLVSGETVIGNYKDDERALIDVAIVQAMPTASGSVQIAMLPYGFPYEEDITGRIDGTHIIYEYVNVPEELKTKYIESKSNIKIASSLGGLGGLGGGDGGSGIIL